MLLLEGCSCHGLRRSFTRRRIVIVFRDLDEAKFDLLVLKQTSQPEQPIHDVGRRLQRNRVLYYEQVQCELGLSPAIERRLERATQDKQIGAIFDGGRELFDEPGPLQRLEQAEVR